MHRTFLIVGVIAAMTVAPISAATAQQPTLPPQGVADTVASQGSRDASMFAPLHFLPRPSEYRTAAGAPGQKYWQNRADYDLHATLDTATHTVSGTMTLRYTNNSPDTLRIMWFQTEQDPDEVIQRFVQLVDQSWVPVTLDDRNTETKVTLAQPLLPGGVATFQVAWHYDRFHGGRTAHRGALYEIAQWYPRVNVYDDVKGWNTEPYTTGAEFYLEYGDFSLSVTVPAGYVVAATGTLDDPNDVLTSTERSRLAVAAKSDTVVHIISPADLAGGADRPTQTGMVTWTFHARNVRDVVWCAAPDFQWDATSWHGILAQSYYEPSAPPSWGRAADMARMSIMEYSTRWFPYPYPQVSVVAGPVFGMEYPMLSMDGDEPGTPQLYGVITHEVGHNWFPMVVGSNERVHTWMDEGINTFINTFSEARRYPALGSQLARGVADIRWLGQQTLQGRDGILETGQVIGNDGGQYYKTDAVLEMLRRDVMGPAAFDAGFQTYIRRWAYRHPTPADFFRTMNEAAGENLGWFWREWFLEAPTFDQAIDSVQVTAKGQGSRVRVVYGNKAAGVMPLLVRFTFGDGTAQDFTYPVDIWKHAAIYAASYDFPKTVARIWIDQDRHFIDLDRSNNRWLAPAAPGTVASRGAPVAGESVATHLTADDLAQYLAVKRAVGSYWQSHAALYQRARSTHHVPVVRYGGRQVSVGVFDYPALVQQDTGLVAVFTANHFATTQFEPTQVAVYQALLAATVHQTEGVALPPATTALGRNIALVTARLQELAAAGIAIQLPERDMAP